MTREQEYASSPSLWLSRPARPQHVEVAVIGGGIVGASVAWWLGLQGRQVTILESDQIASRASGRNAGYLLTGSAEPFTALVEQMGPERALRFWRLSAENRELLRRLFLEEGKIECFFQPEGSWMASILRTAGQEWALEESYNALSKEGFRMRWIRGQEVREVSGSPRLGGAIFQPDDAGIDPVRLVRGIVGLSGAEVRTGCRVQGFEPFGDAIRVGWDGGHLLADWVVVATNAYAAQILPELQGSLWPARGQILTLGPGGRPLKGVWYINEGFEYIRQLPDGSVVLGGGRQSDFEGETSWIEAPTGAVQTSLESFLRETFPLLAKRTITNRWAGIMCLTADGLPCIGTSVLHPRLVYAVGCNGHGMSFGFVTGRHVAEGISQESISSLYP